MIFGAPGCGKTTYLIELLQSLLEVNEPDKIAFVSFTRKGSYEGRDKAIEKFSLKEKDFPFFRTIHSLAFRSLGMSKYEMISRKNYREFSKAMGMNFLGYYTEDLVSNDDQYLFYNSLQKNNRVKSEEVLENLNFQTAKCVSKNYERYKDEAGVKDFDDLLVDFIKNSEALPVDIAIIDEAQDLTTLQWEFCKVAFKNCKQVFIAGDDDQAIYEWSGADLKQFLSLTKESEITVLDKSFRLKEDILNFAKKITGKITNRVEKEFAPVNKGGNIFFHNSIEDISINSEESYYFLSRNNWYLSKIKVFLRKKGVLYNHKGKLSINISVFNAIKQYEHYRKNSPDKILQSQMIRGLLKQNVTSWGPWFDVFDMELEDKNYLRDLVKNKTDLKKCNITVSTIHGVKGGEADNVVLKLDMTKSVYKSYIGKAEAHESELRCLYVALTRTKKNLHIIYSDTKFGYDDIVRSLI